MSAGAERQVPPDRTVTVLQLPPEMVELPEQRQSTERWLSTLAEQMRLGPGPRLGSPGSLTVTIPYAGEEETRAALDQITPRWAESGITVSTLV